MVVGSNLTGAMEIVPDGCFVFVSKPVFESETCWAGLVDEVEGDAGGDFEQREDVERSGAAERLGSGRHSGWCWWGKR